MNKEEIIECMVNTFSDANCEVDEDRTACNNCEYYKRHGSLCCNIYKCMDAVYDELKQYIEKTCVSKGYRKINDDLIGSIVYCIEKCIDFYTEDTFYNIFMQTCIGFTSKGIAVRDNYDDANHLYYDDGMWFTNMSDAKLKIKELEASKDEEE